MRSMSSGRALARSSGTKGGGPRAAHASAGRGNPDGHQTADGGGPAESGPGHRPGPVLGNQEGSMLIPLLLLTSAAAGSYALFPSTWRKAVHRRGQGKRKKAGFCISPLTTAPARRLPLLSWICWQSTMSRRLFFVVAEFAKANPQLLRRMAEEGHQIGFHSARHRSAYCMTPRQTRQDFFPGIGRAETAGDYPAIFSAALGCGELGVPSSDQGEPSAPHSLGRDGSGLAGGDITAEEIADRLRRRTWPGAVICLHDGRGAEGAPGRTIQALKDQLPRWLEQGYQFRTIEQDE